MLGTPQVSVTCCQLCYAPFTIKPRVIQAQKISCVGLLGRLYCPPIGGHMCTNDKQISVLALECVKRKQYFNLIIEFVEDTEVRKLSN